MRLRLYAWDPIQSRLGVCMYAMGRARVRREFCHRGIWFVGMGAVLG